MPSALAVAGEAILSAVTVEAATAVIIEDIIINAAVGAALGTVSAALGAAAQRRAIKEASASGVELNVQSRVEAIPIAYGNIKRSPGALFLLQTSRRWTTFPPEDEQRLNIGVVFCEGQVNITEVYIDGIAVSKTRTRTTYDKHTHAQVTTTENWWDIVERVGHIHNGEDDQAADHWLLYLTTWEPSIGWTANHRLRGIAYSVQSFIWEEGIYPSAGAGPPVLTADIEGITPPNPITGLPTRTGNPAWALYDYLTNTRYGCAIDASVIDVDSFSEAAAYCDQNISAGSPPELRPRFSCNGLLSPDDDMVDNVQAILSSCNGMLIYSGGMFRLIIDKPETPTFRFTEDMIVGPLSVQLDSRGSRYNRCRATFVNPVPDNKQPEPDFVVADSAEYRTEDGGDLLELQLSLPMTTNIVDATYIATLALQKSRYGSAVTLRTHLAGLSCAVGDVVTLTHSAMGWDEEQFRIVRMALNPEGEIDVSLIEYNEDAYSFDYGSVASDSAIGTTLDDPTDVAEVTGLTLTPTRTATNAGSYSYNILATWDDASESQPFIAGYQIEWKPTSGSDWSHAVIGRKDLTTQEIVGLLDNTSYDVAIRAVSSLGFLSPWVQASVVTLTDSAYIPIVISTDIIPDPAITTQSQWILASSIWHASGGPDNKSYVSFDSTTSSLSAQYRFSGLLVGWPIAATGNEFKVTVVVRRDQAGACVVRIIPAVRASGVSGANYVDIDISSQSLGVWVTREITIGPFADPWVSDTVVPVHRLQMQISRVAAISPAQFSVAGFYVIRV